MPEVPRPTMAVAFGAMIYPVVVIISCPFPSVPFAPGLLSLQFPGSSGSVISRGPSSVGSPVRLPTSMGLGVKLLPPPPPQAKWRCQQMPLGHSPGPGSALLSSHFFSILKATTFHFTSLYSILFYPAFFCHFPWEGGLSDPPACHRAGL